MPCTAEPATGIAPRAGTATWAYSLSSSLIRRLLFPPGKTARIAAKKSASNADTSAGAQVLSVHTCQLPLMRSPIRLIAEDLPLPQGPTSARTLLSSEACSSSRTSATLSTNAPRPRRSSAGPAIGTSTCGQPDITAVPAGRVWLAAGARRRSTPPSSPPEEPRTSLRRRSLLRSWHLHCRPV